MVDMSKNGKLMLTVEKIYHSNSNRGSLVRVSLDKDISYSLNGQNEMYRGGVWETRYIVELGDLKKGEKGYEIRVGDAYEVDPRKMRSALTRILTLRAQGKFKGRKAEDPIAALEALSDDVGEQGSGLGEDDISGLLGSGSLDPLAG